MDLESFKNWPYFSEDELNVCSEILRSGAVNYWTGPHVKAFESEFADYLGSSFAVAVSNGTAALELSLKALGVGLGDEVIIPARSFFATVSAVVAVGATPVFADVEVSSGNISVDSAEEMLSPNTRAVICVHLGGQPCDMDRLLELTNSRGIFLVEDCAQAHGAVYKGRMVGSIGHVAAWSFCQDKIISTAGEGGMVTTSLEHVWASIWSLKDHGKAPSVMDLNPLVGSFRWVHERFGSNYRMTEIQAAIGRRQLLKLNRWVCARGTNANVYQSVVESVDESFDCLNVAISRCSPLCRADSICSGCLNSYYRFYLYLKPEVVKERPDFRVRIISKLLNRGLPSSVGSCCEMFLEPAFERLVAGQDFRVADCKNARLIGDTSIALLTHPTITPSDLRQAADIIFDTFEEVCG